MFRWQNAYGVSYIGNFPLELLVVVGGDGGEPAGDGREPVALRHRAGGGGLARVGMVDDPANHVERRILAPEAARPHEGDERAASV
jgi:hypothetical protein